ncbi:MAG: hypothetical protein HYS27_14325 [Deltaproteobacteria bacterium]|nr:hypothetical protein [Deltaproteobacteria bacterium]
MTTTYWGCSVIALTALLASGARAAGPVADAPPERPAMTEQTPAESSAWLISVGALGGAVGYGLGVIAATVATNGANPVNAALQHPGEWGLILTGLLVPIPMTGLMAGAVTLLARDWVTGLAVAAATAGVALVGHGTLLVIGAAGIGEWGWQIEGVALVVVGALVATAGGATAGLVQLVE